MTNPAFHRLRSRSLAILLMLAWNCASQADDSISGPFVPGSGHWNPVKDGSFEVPAGPLPVYTGYPVPGVWYLSLSPGGGSGTADYSADAALVGQGGVRVQPTTFNAPGIALTYGAVIPLTPGKKYVLSGFINWVSPAGSGANTYFDLWGAPGNITLYPRRVPGWQFVYGTFTPTVAPVGIRAGIGNIVSTNDVFYIDEMAITPADQFVPPVQASPALPQLIDIAFGTDGSTVRTGPAAVGIAPSDVWNLYSRDIPGGGYRNDGALAPLKLSDGTPSSAGLLVGNAAGAWANGNLDPMFGIFLYPLTPNPNVTVTVTNLADGLYDVYAYGHGGPPNEENTVFNLMSAGNDYGDKATATDGSWTQIAWVEGAQYVLYSNVLVQADQPLVLTAKPGMTSYACLNGLQLIHRSAESLVLNPVGGFFTNHVLVQIFGSLGRDVRYTIDGTEPLATSAKYTGPLEFKAATVLQARVFTDGVATSAVYKAEYLRVYALNDGISAAWRQQYFGPGYLTDPRVAAEADPDNDGANNLQEFGNGTNPLDPLSGFAVQVRLIPSITWNSVSNVVYRVLRKDRLDAPDWIEVQQIRAFGNRTTYSDEGVADVPRYYLIKAIAP